MGYITRIYSYERLGVGIDKSLSTSLSWLISSEHTSLTDAKNQLSLLSLPINGFTSETAKISQVNPDGSLTDL